MKHTVWAKCRYFEILMPVVVYSIHCGLTFYSLLIT